MSEATALPEAALAAQIADLRHTDLPSDVVDVASDCLLDVLGVTVAGATEPAVTRLRDALWTSGAAPGGATVIGSGDRVRASEAALLNGTAGHALDYDDVAGAIAAHPSVPVFPAVLALAEEMRLSGAALLTAFVAGYETEVRVGLALGPEHYRRGFHTTATVGTIGAAAAAASLLGLDAERTATALGIAATQAAGLKGMFGTDCKPFHAGRAASAGVLAAQLAERGFTANPNFLSAAQTMGQAQSESPDPDQLAVPFGERWHLPDCLFKLHAACYLTHAAIEGTLALRDVVEPDEVERIELRVPPGHLSVCDIAKPRTGLQGKFSLRFVTALALVTGRTDESVFDEAHVLHPRLRALADRVDVVPDGTIAPYATTVRLRTVADVEHVRTGDVGTPAWGAESIERRERLAAKFRLLVSPILGETGTERLVATVRDIAGLAHAADLVPKAAQAS